MKLRGGRFVPPTGSRCPQFDAMCNGPREGMSIKWTIDLRLRQMTVRCEQQQKTKQKEPRMKERAKEKWAAWLVGSTLNGAHGIVVSLPQPFLRCLTFINYYTYDLIKVANSEIAKKRNISRAIKGNDGSGTFRNI